MSVCSECGAKRGHLFGCSASAIKIQPTTPLEPTAETEAPTHFEQYRLLALPAMYAGMWWFSSTTIGPFFLRTFFGMWLHEMGHAAAAWVTGRWALPLPWVTFSFDRNIVVSLLVFGGAGSLIHFGRRGSRVLLGLGVTLLAVAVAGHLAPESVQEPFFTFGGEAGAMIFGALLSCAFLVDSPLRPFRGGLRWGWLVIGAASWADAMRVWWACRQDFANVPFGLEDGMPSDASRLVDEFGWDTRTMVNRFVLVGCVSLTGVAVAWLVALRRQRQTLRRHDGSF